MLPADVFHLHGLVLLDLFVTFRSDRNRFKKNRCSSKSVDQLIIYVEIIQKHHDSSKAKMFPYHRCLNVCSILLISIKSFQLNLNIFSFVMLV